MQHFSLGWLVIVMYWGANWTLPLNYVYKSSKTGKLILRRLALAGILNLIRGQLIMVIGGQFIKK